MVQENRVMVVAGPTASGKSALAIDIASIFDGEIINADSMQVYKDMPIITACPTEEEMRKVPHHLYQIYDPSYNGTVVEWLDKAVEKIHECWAKNKLPVVVGGTGMYISNLMFGTTTVPEATQESKDNLRALCKQIGLRNVYDKLAEVDPKTAARIHPGDTSRVMRAYGIYMQTGVTLSEWRARPMLKKLPEGNFCSIKLFPEREELDARCFARFDHMMQNGALAEVVKLAERNLPDTLPAMKALGVPELMRFIRGECSLEEAVELGKLHTRQYAKRQKTWFAHKLRSDIYIKECYTGQKNLINDVKKIL